MNRIEKLKKFLQKFYQNYQAFNTRNLASDAMVTVYTEDKTEFKLTKPLNGDILKYLD